MTIKPGDLVMVVKPSTCCGSTGAMRKVFVVAKVDAEPCWILCIHCGVSGSRIGALDTSTGLWYSTSRLKKIPPLREPEIIEERLAVKA